MLGKSAAAVLFVATTTKLVGRNFAWQGLESVRELIPRYGVQKDAGRDESRQGDSKRCARRRPCRRQSWPSRAKSVVIRVYTCVHMSYAHMNAAVEHFCYFI